MKRQGLMILTTLSLLVMLAAASVYAQSDMRIKVNIPFEFSVGTKILPAGEYTVSYMVQTLLVIRSADSSASQVFLAVPARASNTPYESSLVFHRYGDQYFLSTIWTAGEATGHELRELRAERELIKARIKSAYSASERQIVSITAHQ